MLFVKNIDKERVSYRCGIFFQMKKLSQDSD